MKLSTTISGHFIGILHSFHIHSRDDDDKAVPESQVSWTLSLPEDIENPTLSDLKVTVTNINTNTQYDGSVSMNEQTVTVTATVPEGLYRLIAEGKVSYSISGIQTPTVANIRAYQESVTISGTTVTPARTGHVFLYPLYQRFRH